ncbi:MAG: class I SAM-dependent methyltransferase, partial [Actinomycetota bacterium]
MFHRPKSSPETEHAAPAFHAVDWRSYDHVAEDYARLVARRHAAPAADLLTLVAPPPGGRVLDIGTGTGIALTPAAGAVGEGGVVVGLDPSREMLRQARLARVPGSLVGGEAIDLPFRDETFDAAVGNFVLSHFTKHETALHDMVRVLRRGGRLGLTAWVVAEDEFGRVWREQAEAVVGKDLYQDAVARALPSERRVSDPDRMTEALRGAGLRDVDIQRRDYRFEMTVDEYLAAQKVRLGARALHRIMGDAVWERFREQVSEEFHRRFRDPIGDTQEVLFGIGTKP